MSRRVTENRVPIKVPMPLVLTFGFALMTLMILGSAFDYAVSEALLDESSIFGRMGATFGWFPSAFAICSSGVLLVRAGGLFWVKSPGGHAANAVHSWEKVAPSQEEPWHWHRGVEIAAGFALITGSTLLIVLTAPHYWSSPIGYADAPLILWILIALVGNGAVALLTCALSDGASPKQMRAVALFLLLVVLIQSAIIFVVKLVWMRPRMRLIADGVGVFFASWWSVGYPGAQQFLSEGVAADGFKSFPSAHTGNAAVALSLGALGTLNDRGRKTIPWILTIAVVWVVAVAVSRIIVGAHFITDTTVGFAIGAGCSLTVYWALFLRRHSQSIT